MISIVAAAAPAMPPDFWWVTLAVFLLLFLAAAIDAVSKRVPDAITIWGLLALTGMQGVYTSWPEAAQHLRLALGVGFAIWALNAFWFRLFKYDALGMGDAKWSALAASAFGLAPVLVAWGVGAILACAFLLAARLARRKISHPAFAPFLMIGLCAGIYWLRFLT